jgi:hypothetical protein
MQQWVWAQGISGDGKVRCSNGCGHKALVETARCDAATTINLHAHKASRLLGFDAHSACVPSPSHHRDFLPLSLTVSAVQLCASWRFPAHQAPCHPLGRLCPQHPPQLAVPTHHKLARRTPRICIQPALTGRQPDRRSQPPRLGDVL